MAGLAERYGAQLRDPYEVREIALELQPDFPNLPTGELEELFRPLGEASLALLEDIGPMTPSTTRCSRYLENCVAGSCPRLSTAVGRSPDAGPGCRRSTSVQGRER
jgi:hypothetical protein